VKSHTSRLCGSGTQPGDHRRLQVLSWHVDVRKSVYSRSLSEVSGLQFPACYRSLQVQIQIQITITYRFSGCRAGPEKRDLPRVSCRCKTPQLCMLFGTETYGLPRKHIFHAYHAFQPYLTPMQQVLPGRMRLSYELKLCQSSQSSWFHCP